MHVDDGLGWLPGKNPFELVFDGASMVLQWCLTVLDGVLMKWCSKFHGLMVLDGLIVLGSWCFMVLKMAFKGRFVRCPNTRGVSTGQVGDPFWVDLSLQVPRRVQPS